MINGYLYHISPYIVIYIIRNGWKSNKKKEAKIEKISWQTKNSNMKSNKKWRILRGGEPPTGRLLLLVRWTHIARIFSPFRSNTIQAIASPYFSIAHNGTIISFDYILFYGGGEKQIEKSNCTFNLSIFLLCFLFVNSVASRMLSGQNALFWFVNMSHVWLYSTLLWQIGFTQIRWNSSYT